MSSSTPTFATDWQATDQNYLDRALWNAVFAELAGIIAGLQSSFQTIEAINQSTIDQSLAVIAQSVEPQVLALQAAVTAAQAELDSLVASGVSAGDVSITSIAGLDAATVQAALAELTVNLATLTQGLVDEVAARSAAIDAAIAASRRTVVETSTAITASPNDIVYVDSSGGDVPITMPTTADTTAAGRVPIDVIPVSTPADGAMVIITPNTGQTVDGQSSLTIDVAGFALGFTLVGTDWVSKSWGVLNG